MLVLNVSLRVQPGKRDEFLEGITAQARTSVREEPGCLAFEVSEDVEDADHFLFHEIYRDDESLQAHGQTPHFFVWREIAGRVTVPDSTEMTVTRVVVAVEDES